MKFIKRLFYTLLLIIVLLIASAYLFNFDYLLRAVRTIYLKGHTTAFLEDYQSFDNRVIATGTPQAWDLHPKYNQVPATDKLQKTHQETGTVAFLIIKEDKIFHESYFDGFDKDSKSNSFSMAKSIVSACLGKAIQEGKIKSLDQKVADFFPELKGEFAQEVTVGDLSSMASGMDWDERYYSPFSITTRAYFDDALEKMMLNRTINQAPGKSYLYLSGSTQLLAMVIQKATGEQLSGYVSKHFWKPMGAENEALWQVDRPDGIEKAYCCVATNARDFARFGKLYKQNGMWNGQQILDSSFVSVSTKARFEASPEYGYGWWLAEYNGKKIFYMRGHLGQYVIVVPEDDLMVIRLGHRVGKKLENNPHSEDFYTYLEATYQMLAR
jgi:CubicO group peptidase (beta-lactamase class C family)